MLTTRNTDRPQVAGDRLVANRLPLSGATQEAIIMKITREFNPADRYKYDFGQCSIKNGWAQVDTSQDASYFGTWANPRKLAIFTYCEGDVTLQQAESVSEFVSAIRAIQQWNNENGHRFIGIDAGFPENGLHAEFEAIGLADML